MAQEDSKVTVEEYLNHVDYNYLNNDYIPSVFAINYMNFIKMVNAGKDDIQTSPAAHYKMADSLNTKRTKIANLCSRGFGKALSLDTEILTPTGSVTMEEIQVGDKVFDRNGKITEVTFKSEVFTNQCYKFILEDGSEFIANEDHIHILQRRTATRKVGAYWKEIELTTKELLDLGDIHYTRKVTEKNPTGKESKWFIPLISNPLDYPTQNLSVDPYTLGVILGDGSIDAKSGIVSVSGSLDDLTEILSKISYSYNHLTIDARTSNNYYTRLLGSGKDIKALLPTTPRGRNKYIPTEYLIGSKEQRLAILRGLMDTDGTITATGHSTFTSVSWHLAKGIKHLVKSLGGYASMVEKENDFGKYYDVHIHMWEDCPFTLKRKVDRWVPNKNYRSGKRVAIKSIEPIESKSQCIQVASDTHSYVLLDGIVTHNTVVMGEMLILYLAVFTKLPYVGKCNVIMYVADSMENGAKSLRANIEARYNHSPFLQEYIPKVKFTDTELVFTNKAGEETYVRLFGASSGVRGFKRNGDRPVLAILDDLISDEMANSKIQLEKVYDLIYKAVDNALNPKRNKIIFSGTPFNKADPLYQAIESGAWEVNVYPICEQFPCTEDEFKGGWEERFGYDEIRKKFDDAVKIGRVKAFNQELMLRISSDEDRVIQDEDIAWFNVKDVLDYKRRYNFYITTDFATSTNRKADYTVIGVWAVDKDQNRYLVDGKLGRFLMNETFKTIFKYVKKYQPMSVGIEATGQQGGFISLLKEEMLKRNTWFNIAKSKGSSKEGISVKTNKMDRFRLTEPYFKQKKIYLPNELKSSNLVTEILEELTAVTIDGIKSVHDDAIDMISQLDQMYVLYPDEYQANLGNKEVSQDEEYDPYFNDNLVQDVDSNYQTYLV